jgi:hypothetical protein
MEHTSSVPEVSFFSKHEKSVQYSKKSQNEVSIQNAPFYNEVSIQQNQLSQHDFSVQNIANVEDNAAQVSHDAKNVSIQYSAKPIFENISQDFMSDHDEIASDGQYEEESNINNEQTRPVQNDKGLRAELELDIDEKLKRK